MNEARPRTSRAPGPVKSGKPEPVSLVPRGRSKSPRLWPISQCGRGVNVEVTRRPPACAPPDSTRRRHPAPRAARVFGTLSRWTFEQRFDVAQIRLESAHRFARGLQRGQQVVGRLLGPLQARDLLGLRVALGLEPFDLGHQGAPPCVELDHAIELLEGDAIAVGAPRRRGRRQGRCEGDGDRSWHQFREMPGSRFR